MATTTDPADKRGRRSSPALAVAAVSAAAFLALLGGLAKQMRDGDDPAVAATPAEQPRPKRVRLRRIRETVVVTRVPAGEATAAVVPGAAPAPADGTATPPPAPAAAPAAPPTAAPAPTPAPVTRSS